MRNHGKFFFDYSCHLIGYAVAPIIFALLMLGGTAVIAESHNLPWAELSENQQLLLKRMQPRWDQLLPEQRQKLLRRADRFIAMSPEQRERFGKRITRWRAMPKEKRGAVMHEYRRFRSLPPAKREALKKRYRYYQALPPERKQQLREKWRERLNKKREFIRENEARKPDERSERPKNITRPERTTHTHDRQQQDAGAVEQRSD